VGVLRLIPQTIDDPCPRAPSARADQKPPEQALNDVQLFRYLVLALRRAIKPASSMTLRNGRIFSVWTPMLQISVVAKRTMATTDSSRINREKMRRLMVNPDLILL